MAVLQRVPQHQWRVRFAPDGQTFADIDVGQSWVLDALVTRRNTLLLALSAGRSGAVRLVRIDHARGVQTETTLPHTHGSSEYRLVEAGARVWLLGARGGYVSGDDGASFRSRGHWEIDTYGFYAASVAADGAAVSFVAPSFDTCSSSDHLEAAHVVRVGPTAAAQRIISDVTANHTLALFMGRHGVLYQGGMVDGAGACRLSARTGGRSTELISVPRDSRCDIDVTSNGRFTVATVEGRVIRLNGRRALALGVAPADAPPHRVFPDSRGRALAVTLAEGDGFRLFRYARGRAPERLL